jgi:hypothetical protein
MIYIILTISPLPPQVFLLYMRECKGHMSRIFWITEVIHPCYFNPEMLNEVFPDIVRGMTKFLASGHTGKSRTGLRKQFETFCDKVGLVNDAVRKCKDANEKWEAVMSLPPNRYYLEFQEDLVLKEPHPKPVSYHGYANPLSCPYCETLATQVTHTIPLLCKEFTRYWTIHGLVSAFGDETKHYTYRSWD